MATVDYAHISLNSSGVPIIAGTGAKVRMLVMDHIGQGWDAEEIHRQYPHLTLGQIHRALAYYYDHQTEMDAEIAQDLKDADLLLAKIDIMQGAVAAESQVESGRAGVVSVTLYMDHHVPSAITEGLRRRGVDVLTVWEDTRSEAGDELLLARATALARALFSRDLDLLGITAVWLAEGKTFSGLIYAHQLQVSIGKAVEDLEIITKVADPMDMENRVLRLPL